MAGFGNECDPKSHRPIGGDEIWGRIRYRIMIFDPFFEGRFRYTPIDMIWGRIRYRFMIFDPFSDRVAFVTYRLI